MPCIDSLFALSTISILYKTPLVVSPFLRFYVSLMFPELEKPRVTEIQVRMDCNGCVQKIKKALNGIKGIYDIYIDFPQQKLTIIGWADPEKIIKAIKKARKTATICSHSEPSDPPAQPTEPPPYQPPEPPPEPPPYQPPEPAPPPDPSPPEAPPAEPTQPPEPPNELPPNEPPPAPPENPPSDPPPPNVTNKPSSSKPKKPSRPKDVEEVHVIYHHPPDYGYRYSYGHGYGHSFGGHWNNYPNGPGFQQVLPSPPPPVYVTQSYNTNKPSPYATHSYNTYRPSPYVTEYEYIRSPPREMHYSRPESYRDDYHNSNNGNGNGNITSIFSDENPNACRIV